ncbi:hypothetical protein NA57DRAFT_77459 [Rhizodiscina lignyota]|uniref:Uncharacterized protein n=1 Tax=Rhizodiscina lignyota TaxID=1504668 RepID=A0A9P4I8Y3_9PEZI|nr:hypothetical protein NA57DRAFT_77459 [Rhizodiscina lignyota]
MASRAGEMPGHSTGAWGRRTAMTQTQMGRERGTHGEIARKPMGELVRKVVIRIPLEEKEDVWGASERDGLHDGFQSDTFSTTARQKLSVAGSAKHSDPQPSSSDNQTRVLSTTATRAEPPSHEIGLEQSEKQALEEASLGLTLDRARHINWSPEEPAIPKKRLSTPLIDLEPERKSSSSTAQSFNEGLRKGSPLAPPSTKSPPHLPSAETSADLPGSMDELILKMSKHIAQQVREELFKEFQTLIPPGASLPPETPVPQAMSSPTANSAQTKKPTVSSSPRGTDSVQKQRQRSQVRASGSNPDQAREVESNGRADVRSKYLPRHRPAHKPDLQKEKVEEDADDLRDRADEGTDQSSKLSIADELFPKRQLVHEPEEASSTTTSTSLVDELFPDRVKKEEESSQQEREIPRLKLGSSDQRGSDSRSHRKAAVDQRRRIPQDFASLGEDPTVLLLRNASNSLVEDDFKRLIPKGKHIPEWQGIGGFVKVIPGRDPHTMERQNFYYIIFKSDRAASAYLANVSKHHRIARENTQSSMLSHIPPPPGYQVKGDDLDAFKQAYGLMSTTQKLQLSFMKKPYSPWLQRLVVEGGYSKIAQWPHKHKVLLFIEGAGQQTSDIERFISLEGKRRGLPFAVVDAQDAIVKVTAKESRKGRDNEDFIETGDIEDERSDSDVEDSKDNSDALLAPSEEKLSQDVRWIVSFESDAEAKRFARSVHGRRFPIYPEGSLVYERPGKMWVEVLW